VAYGSEVANPVPLHLKDKLRRSRRSSRRWLCVRESPCGHFKSAWVTHRTGWLSCFKVAGKFLKHHLRRVSVLWKHTNLANQRPHLDTAGFPLSFCNHWQCILYSLGIAHCHKDQPPFIVIVNAVCIPLAQHTASTTVCSCRCLSQSQAHNRNGRAHARYAPVVTIKCPAVEASIVKWKYRRWDPPQKGPANPKATPTAMVLKICRIFGDEIIRSQHGPHFGTKVPLLTKLALCLQQTNSMAKEVECKNWMTGQMLCSVFSTLLKPKLAWGARTTKI